MNSLLGNKDNFELNAILACNETCITSTLNYDVVLTRAFEQLSKGTKRSEYYYIIAKHLTNHRDYHFAKDYRLLEFPEEFIEAASQDDVEETSFLIMFEALIESTEGKKVFSTTNTNKSATKPDGRQENKSEGRIFTKLLTFLKNSLVLPHSHIGLKVLQLLAKSSLRSQLTTHASSVCNACLNAVDNYTQRDELSTTFALYASLLVPGNRSSEVELTMISWRKYFVDFTLECSSIVLAFGIVDRNRDQAIAQKLIPFEIGVNIQSRVEKAIYLMQRFVSICAIMKQMLIFGCSTGHILLDLTAFLPLSSWLYEFNADLNATDPVNFVQNVSGYSPMDICLVVSKMKIALIDLTTQLFIINPPSLIMVAQALYRPIASLSAKPEAQKIAGLKLALTKCLGHAAKCFPSIAVESMEGGSHVILTWLLSDIKQLTTIGTLTSDRVDNVDTELTLTLINISELVLVSCASSLLPKVRQLYEDFIGQVLLCLSKGLLYPQYTDRRMHRCEGERIRQDLVLQNAFLRLAAIEVLVPASRVGMGSSNVSLLKSVAQNCLGHPTTFTEASRTLLVLSSLVHPSTVSLPAIPANDIANSYLSALADSKQRAVDAKSSSSSWEFESKSEPSADLAQVPAPAIQERPVDISEVSSAKRARVEVPIVAPTAPVDPFQGNPLPKLDLEALERHKAATSINAVSKPVDNDNDSLPDIDIS